MADAERPSDPADLKERYQALDAQVKLLVRSEQRLHMSQRELGRQLRRVDAVNRLALDAAQTDQPTAIAALAFDMLFEAFPYEQGLALVASESGTLRPLAQGAVPGREHGGASGIARLQRRTLARLEVPAGPVIVARSASAEPPVTALLGLLDATFDSPPEQVAEGAALVLPLATQRRDRRGALLLRRLGRGKSFHEVLPTEKDTAYLMLVAQQVAAALGKAELVVSLRKSYDDLEKAQRELVDRERLAAIGELAAVVAHEVRNPLAAIFNSVAALKRVAEPQGQTRLLLDVLSEEARRLNRIVTDLIDFARPTTAIKRDVALAPVVSGAIESASDVAKARRVDVRMDVEDGLEARVDDHLLRRALLNLVNNASQATDEGGVVEVHARSAGDEVVIRVVDRGQGIASEELDQIFEPFYTTKASGTGLGLAVVRRFVEAHDGTLEVNSDLDRGSEFTIRFAVSSDDEVWEG